MTDRKGSHDIVVIILSELRRGLLGTLQAVSPRNSRPLRGRERLLALMDVGALLCRPREPRCPECPLRRTCGTRGPLADERRSRQPPFAGSFRQRRGNVLARLREEAQQVNAGSAVLFLTGLHSLLTVVAQRRVHLAATRVESVKARLHVMGEAVRQWVEHGRAQRAAIGQSLPVSHS